MARSLPVGTWAGILAVVALTSGGVGCTAPQSHWRGVWQAEGAQKVGGELYCVASKQEDQRWSAQFAGYCGQQFVYQVEMTGHQEADGAISFQGQADLGEKDGGKYEWHGRIKDDQFIGFYASAAGKRGSFTMTRGDPREVNNSISACSAPPVTPRP